MDELAMIKDRAALIRDSAPDVITAERASSILAALSRLEAREAKKTVPMAMLNNAYSVGMDYGRGLADCDRNALKDIAARYGYEVSDDPH